MGEAVKSYSGRIYSVSWRLQCASESSVRCHLGHILHSWPRDWSVDHINDAIRSNTFVNQPLVQSMGILRFVFCFFPHCFQVNCTPIRKKWIPFCHWNSMPSLRGLIIILPLSFVIFCTYIRRFVITQDWSLGYLAFVRYDIPFLKGSSFSPQMLLRNKKASSKNFVRRQSHSYCLCLL